jgi:hypothetical protein
VFFIAQEASTMSDETTTTDTAPAQEAAPKAETFSAEYVQQLRDEAARYRTEKRSAAERAKAEAVKDYEGRIAEKDSAASLLQSELSDRTLELAKLKAVLGAGIASEDALKVAALVQGTDEDSISQSVQSVKSLIGRAPERDRPVDPSQGSGNYVPLNGDPILETVKRMVGA